MHFFHLRAQETVPGGVIVAHIPIVSSDPELGKRSWHMNIMNETLKVGSVV